MKKIKRKKKPPYKKDFSHEAANRPNVHVQEFDSSVQAISSVLRRYSVQDIAASLFVSSLWLPNIASPVKHTLLTAIFASQKPSCFSAVDKIITYHDFKGFLQEIYPLLPSFVMLEDYIPEPDWGDVRFHHADRNYKIFYGNELSNVYDFLSLFQMIYEACEEECRNVIGRSPLTELKYCLQLQDDIIAGITSQPKNGLPEIEPGHIEVPPQPFWEDAGRFHLGYKAEEKVGKLSLKNYSIPLGSLPGRYLEWSIFGEMVHTGQILPAFFILDEGRYFPILPRRFSSILFCAWGKTYENSHGKLCRGEKPLRLSIGAKLYRYIKARIKSQFFPLVSAISPNGKPHETLFSSAFISKDKFILIYVTNPAYSKHDTEKELNKIIPKLKESMELIKTQPVTLALHLERKNVTFQSQRSEESLKPLLFILIPQVKTEMFLSFAEPPPGEVIFMDQFLAIIDELENEEMLASFLEYRNEYDGKMHPSFIGLLDKFASFKDSYGVLIEGASEPDLISLDPHWGSKLRYKTLSEFWKVFPLRGFFDHPRSWKATKVTESMVRLEARGYFGAAIYCRIGSTDAFFNAPFEEMSSEQAQLSNLLMECLEDTISRNVDIVEKHRYFQYYDQIQVLFFPLSLISDNNTFKHLEHLKTDGMYWCSEAGRMVDDLYGIRVVFDDKLLVEAFAGVNDRTLEIGLLVEVLNQLSNIIPDPNMPYIVSSLKKDKAGKPRFKILSVNKEVAFPEFIDSCKPELVHFKKARKTIAELAKECSLSEGDYELVEAKQKLNSLRESLVAEINSEIQKYDYKNAIPFLLTRIDVLNHGYERQKIKIRLSLDHDVDYEREEAAAEGHHKYITMHRNYRYMIEKFVQLQPEGTALLNKEEFQYLAAFIDWLHVFYSAADSLHYGIHPLGMKVNRDSLVEVVDDKTISSNEKEFAQEEEKLKLGLVGNPDDRVSSPRPVKDLLDALDDAFKRDLGFSFEKMINILGLLSQWAGFADVEISPFYSASAEEIEIICMKNIEGFRREDILKILDFLTLKKEEVIRVLNQESPCSDVPVWEYKKRFSRYNIRPLINIDGKLYWGPYSVEKVGIIWSGNVGGGALPYDLQSQEIQRVIETEKKLIEDALVTKALEIMKRYTNYAEKDCFLHKRDRQGGHPSDLGDYDILAFYPDKNIVFNIECKDILPVHCLKDAKSLRETIFGKDGDEGHFRQINKRQDYLESHILKVANALKWPINAELPPKIIPIYLTRMSYWWTRFPPKAVQAQFLRIDMLSKFIDEIE